MGRFLAGLGVAVGFTWFFRRRRKQAPPPAPDPAEDLKQKLAEQRTAEPEPEAAAVPDAPEPEQPEASLDERRDEVHRKARESIDRMRGDAG